MDRENIMEQTVSITDEQTLNKRKKQKRMNKMKDHLFVAAIVSWPLILFAIFWVGGNITNIMMAFQEYNLDTGKFDFLPLKDLFYNFEDFINDFTGTEKGPMMEMVGRSVFFWAFSLITLLPRLLVAFCIHKGIRGAEVFKVLLFLPQIISSVVWCLLFRMFIEYGLPEITEGFGVTMEKSIFMMPDKVFITLILYGEWMGFAGALVINTGTMSRIPPELVEAGKLDGMTTWQEFWFITLPFVYGMVTISVYTSFIWIFTGQPNIYTFYGDSAPGNVYTLGYYFFVMIFGKNASMAMYPYSSAASLVMTALVAPVTMLARWLFEKFGPTVES